MNKNTIIIGIVSVVAIFAFLGIAYVLTNKPPQETAITIPELKKVQAGDHTKWSKANKSVVVEYSDLQCPACRQFHDYITKNLDTDKKITDNVTFVYKHFPLTQIHKNAYRAALAAEAAGKQNKFFEMSDALFTSQEKWSGESNPTGYFMTLVKQLKLDAEKFKKDMDSTEVINQVKANMEEGDKNGINSTPTFFLNGKRLDNIGSYDDLKAQLINSIQ
ncbi:MAG: hypothetical protein RI947_932 [Candidatus Parcubacteria bacterium]|jgi:protein-disulfide isomerase